MEVVRVLLVEEHQQVDDGVPSAGVLRLDVVAADYAHQPVGRPLVRRHLFAVQRRERRHGRVVHDEHVPGERRDHEVDVDTHELLGGDGRARFHQHLEPHGEPMRVELLVQAR